ncbi:MAG TPA: DUF2314 domain-containing protein [Planctomycetota bacterium]|nr:DUF2314 domain-containing protein [Planctomycetota bacterium]
MPYLAVLVLIALAVWWFLSRRARGAGGEGDNRPLFSIVLLLKEPRHLDDKMLQKIAEKAWNCEFPAGENATEFVVGTPPALIIKYRDFMFLVNVFPMPYLKDKEKAAEQIAELRLKHHFLEHTAWWSVDLLGEHTEEQIKEGFTYIGRLVAELADSNCLLLYSPTNQYMNVYTPEMQEKLRGPDPLKDFAAERSFAPVTGISGDDPRMVAAVEEARRRWPEFVAAFETRKSGQKFAIKAPFSDGEHTEYMWMSVSGIENDVIYGQLENDPVNVRGMKLGSRVKTTLPDLNDWIYSNGNEPVGGFTIKILVESMQRGRKP